MEKRNVTVNGIKYRGQLYKADFLNQHIKEQVQIEPATSTNDEKIMVYLGDKFLGYATKEEGGHQESMSST